MNGPKIKIFQKISESRLGAEVINNRSRSGVGV